jgi:5-methylcytosine-specific restriction endonuclease McrA
LPAFRASSSPAVWPEIFMNAAVLDNPVLVLNRLWQAVNTCTVRRAFTLLYQGHAQVVNQDLEGNFLTHDFTSWSDFSSECPGEEMLRGVSMNLCLPQIIVLHIFDRLPKKEIKFTRNNVFERDKNTCQYCGKIFDRVDLNLDHVIPRDLGGATTWENIVCSCIPCNTRKGNKLPHAAGMHLIRHPKKPKWRPFLHMTAGAMAHDSWKHFIDVAYWNVELGE